MSVAQNLKAFDVPRRPIYWQRAVELERAIEKAPELMRKPELCYHSAMLVCSLGRETTRNYQRVWTNSIYRQDAPVLLQLLIRAHECLEQHAKHGVLQPPEDGQHTESSHIDGMLENTENRIKLLTLMSSSDMTWKSRCAVDKLNDEIGDIAKKNAVKYGFEMPVEACVLR